MWKWRKVLDLAGGGVGVGEHSEKGRTGRRRWWVPGAGKQRTRPEVSFLCEKLRLPTLSPKTLLFLNKKFTKYMKKDYERSWK